VVVFWDVALCGLLDIDQHFRGAYCLITLMMDAINSSEVLISIDQTTQGNIPEDSHLR
jgi:hypothetical protein